MHPVPGLVCSNRPEGHLLSYFDSSSIQNIPMVCVRESGLAVQGPPLWALPVFPFFTKVVEGALTPLREVGVRLSEYDSMPHGRAHPSSAELPTFLQRQECGATETVSEAPGAYGIRS